MHDDDGARFDGVVDVPGVEGAEGNHGVEGEDITQGQLVAIGLDRLLNFVVVETGANIITLSPNQSNLTSRASCRLG